MNDKIKKDIKRYNYLKSCALKEINNNRLEASLDYVFLASTYAWGTNLGFLTDDDLEDIIVCIGERLTENRENGQNGYNNEKRHSKVRTVAHVVSFLHDVGGHSKALEQWTRILKGIVNKQFLYITNVNNVPTNYSGFESLKKQEICVRELFCKSRYTDRIAQLSDMIDEDRPDVVIMYINPNDVIAATALQITQHKPWVLFFNHADHIFWIGKKTIDLLIEFRSISADYSSTLRGINRKKIFVIPLTTDIKPKKTLKSIYGVPNDSTLSVSIGSLYKVIEKNKSRYFELIDELLVRFPNHFHIFVTDKPGLARTKWISKNPLTQGRFIVIGPLNDLAPIYGVADFVIETFPMCGGTVRVEAMACKLPVVAFMNKQYDILSECDSLPPDYGYRFSDVNEALLHSSLFIREPVLRNNIGQELYRRYYEMMSHDSIYMLWKNILQNIVMFENTKATNKTCNATDRVIDNEFVYNWREQISSNRFTSNISMSRFLMSQSLVKQSEFSFKDRLYFCYDDFRNPFIWAYKAYKNHINNSLGCEKKQKHIEK